MIAFFFQLASCFVLINLCSCYKVRDFLKKLPAKEKATQASLVNGLDSPFEVKSVVEDDDSVFDTVTRLWAVKLKNIDKLTSDEIEEKGNKIARELHLINLGKIGSLSGHYIFAAPNFTTGGIEKTLRNHAAIDLFERQELMKIRKYRGFSNPAKPSQWHLFNQKKHQNKPLLDCNVTNVWRYNIQGQGVVVAILDDGVDWRHNNLKDNFFGFGSYDFVAEDSDPTPSKWDHHGTQCAGVASAASKNHKCGVGVAYQSKFSGIRATGPFQTYGKMAEAFNYKFSENHIFSSSWGPEDDGKTVDSINWLIDAALALGAEEGRDTYGSIFVFAAGNGGRQSDNCNYDGYVSSIYVIPITSVTEYGVTPIYGERCTSIMTSTLSGPDQPSSGRNITTTFILNTCSIEFSGTSAAAPLASGIIALMLQVRPCLYWRDVHHIIAMTSSHVTLSGEVELFDSYQNPKIPSHFHINKAGYTYNDYHGFGFLDAWKVVNAARVWKPVPKMTKFEPKCDRGNQVITLDKPLELSCHASKTGGVATIENVVVKVSIDHTYRGMLEYVITCPSGTESVVATRPLDTSKKGLKNHAFRTVKCWGESASGEFKMKINDTRNSGTAGRLLGWEVTVYGSEMSARDLRDRWKAVEKSYSDGGDQLQNKFDNSPSSCPAFINWVIIVIVVLAVILVVFLSCLLYCLCMLHYKRKKNNIKPKPSNELKE